MTVNGLLNQSDAFLLLTLCCAAQVFTDMWFTPAIKIVIDQTVWAVTWNSLYYCLLGQFLKTLCPQLPFQSHLSVLSLALTRHGLAWDAKSNR